MIRQETEISVQCDVQVFAWLLQWATAKHAAATPAPDSASAAAAAAAAASITPAAPCLTSANVLCILISSNFLKMDTLVEECVRFIALGLADSGPASVQAEHLLELPLALFSQLAMVNPNRITSRVASSGETALPRRRRAVTLDTLESLAGVGASPAVPSRAGPDPRPRHEALLAHRLYKYRLEGLLKERGTTLCRCAVCGRRYSVAERAILGCSPPSVHLPEPGQPSLSLR
ncbi:MAG: hypothetical protein WDW38_008277 [Sanguina aurantia]